jgi:putative endonuclease
MTLFWTVNPAIDGEIHNGPERYNSIHTTFANYGQRTAVVYSQKQLGEWGESLAAEHLAANGYEIVVRNWRCRQGEIDIVAWAGLQLVFVEVKTRRGQAMGSPEESITQQKAQRLTELATIYAAEMGGEVDWRIDLVAVELDDAGHLLRCDHVPNVVLGW